MANNLCCKPLIIGITGGTGSGKSTVAKKILDVVGYKNVAVLEQDCYYKDQSHLVMDDRTKTNYDHPLAFDTDLLVEHLKQLARGESIEKPQYDFTIHNRKTETETVECRKVIMVEGILVLEAKELRDLMDIKIFVDTDADVRIIRRIVRDMKERGRTLEAVIKQYLDLVKPAHENFIEPTKKFADIIIPEGGNNEVAIDIVVTKLKSILGEI